VTDLSPAVEEVEEIEEIEHLEPVDFPPPPTDAVSPGSPASLRILAPPTEPAIAEVPPPVVDEPVPVPPAVAEPAAAALTADESYHAAPPDAETVPSDTGPRPGDAELREFFAGRAAEIFRAVASEAVEKVMWEMTDRLAAEFSARLRESVEAVAWEVIPSTAEVLIREEIARIRGQAGKPSP
jgi:hypothetical protein